LKIVKINVGACADFFWPLFKERRRVIAPVKDDIKHIKRIGPITFNREKSGDFRAGRGATIGIPGIKARRKLQLSQPRDRPAR
jgi:hypothetical protein